MRVAQSPRDDDQTTSRPPDDQTIRPNFGPDDQETHRATLYYGNPFESMDKIDRGLLVLKEEREV